MMAITQRDRDLLTYLQSFLTERRRTLFDKVLDQRTQHITVVTEDVYHLHNTSAVMRNCDVFGVQDLHVIEEVNYKTIDREIALGAQKWVNLHRHHQTKDCMKKLKADGYRIVATSPHKSAHRLEDFDVTQKSAIFFGKEVEGLSDLVLEEADDFIYIPMCGFTESLNISVSAAIVLQQLTTKLRKSDITWKITGDARFHVEMKWTRQMLKKVEMYVERFDSQH